MSASASDKYFLRSQRLGFRYWREEDLPLALQLWGNPEVTRFFYKDPLSDEQVAQRLKNEIHMAAEHQVQYWPIFSLQDHSHIGCAGLRPYSEDVLELGFHLKPEHWGMGYASETGRFLINHAFENRLASAIFAGHHPENKASRNTLLKLGFIGITSELYKATGLTSPSYFIYRDPQPYHTRPAVADDARALAIVHSLSIKATFANVIDDYVAARSLDYCEEAWSRRIANNECKTIVLLHGKQIIGFAAVAPSPDSDLTDAGELDRIYLHPSAQGKGLGANLLKWCEETLIADGFKTISLYVFEVNTAARRFYEKHGYKPDGHSKQDFNSQILRYIKCS